MHYMNYSSKVSEYFPVLIFNSMSRDVRKCSHAGERSFLIQEAFIPPPASTACSISRVSQNTYLLKCSVIYYGERDEIAVREDYNHANLSPLLFFSLLDSTTQI